MKASGRPAAGGKNKVNRSAASGSRAKRGRGVRTAASSGRSTGTGRTGSVRKTGGKRVRKPSSEQGILTQWREQNGLSMILASLVVIIILVMVGVNAVSLGRRLVENKKRLETLREEIRMEDERADDIEEYRRYTRTDAYIEEVAREKLGLIYEGETVFKEENK